MLDLALFVLWSHKIVKVHVMRTRVIDGRYKRFNLKVDLISCCYGDVLKPKGIHFYYNYYYWMGACHSSAAGLWVCPYRQKSSRRFLIATEGTEITRIGKEFQ